MSENNTKMSFGEGRHPNDLWGRARKEPEWQHEVNSNSGTPTGVLVHRANGNRIRRDHTTGKWKSV